METDFFLQRFIEAQESIYDDALSEIREGKKKGDWIWFIFPQLQGLGVSHNSKYYAIRGLDEAREYYGNPILRKRLREITLALLLHDEKTISDIFSEKDPIKIRSCMTLFWYASQDPIFSAVIDVFFNGVFDNYTTQILKSRVSDILALYDKYRQKIENYFEESKVIEEVDELIRQSKYDKLSDYDILWTAPDPWGCSYNKKTLLMLDGFELDKNQIFAKVYNFHSGPPDYGSIDIALVPDYVIYSIDRRLKKYIFEQHDSLDFIEASE